MPKDNVFPAINKQGVSVIRSSFVLENFHIFLEWKIGILSTETALFMDRSRHFILLSMKRWLLVDGNAKQPGFSVEPKIFGTLSQGFRRYAPTSLAPRRGALAS